MKQFVDEAADALERQVFFDQLSARYEVLRGDPKEWREIEGERTLEGGSDLRLCHKATDTALMAEDRRAP
jgi:hypothetical protein